MASDQKAADEVKTRVTSEEAAVGVIAEEARAIAAHSTLTLTLTLALALTLTMTLTQPSP